jgi:hypothetical protein
VEGSCEHCNESSGSIKCWEVLEWPHNWRLLKTVSAQLAAPQDGLSSVIKCSHAMGVELNDDLSGRASYNGLPYSLNRTRRPLTLNPATGHVSEPFSPTRFLSFFFFWVQRQPNAHYRSSQDLIRFQIKRTIRQFPWFNE